MSIRLRNVWKQFRLDKEVGSLKESFVKLWKSERSRKIWALRNVNLEVEEGQCIALIGENGSGKTTLLKVMAGILPPTKGKVEISGKIAALLTLGLGFNPELNAKDNVYLFGAIIGLSKKEMREKYQEIVEFAELQDYMDVKLKNFSDGMRVRLGFATAIHVDADIILIDEVMVVGDGAFQVKCLERFKELKKKGRIIVFVSHNLDFVKTYSDKVAWLHRGRIEAFGPPSEVLKKYERYLKEKEIRIHNEAMLKKLRIKVKFLNHLGEVKWVFEEGEQMIVSTDLPKPKDITLTFTGPVEAKLIGRKRRFRLDLTLPPGSYRVGTDLNGKEGYLKLEVFEGTKSRSIKIFSQNYPQEIVAFGRDCEKLLSSKKDFLIFSDLDFASSERDKGAFFLDGKLVAKGDAREVREKYEEFWYNRTKQKYGI